MARQLDAAKPADLGRELLGKLDRHRVGRRADDDVTVITVRHPASRAPPL
jgi:hypothetical protein